MQRFLLFVTVVTIATTSGCFPSFAPKQVNLDDFGIDADVAADRELVVLKFGADWCGPCRSVDQSLEELKRSHGGSLIVKKIDVDKQRDLAQQFGVGGIPHLFLVKDGVVVDSAVGSKSHDALTKWVEGAGATPGPAPLGPLHGNPFSKPEDLKVTPVNLTPHQTPATDTLPKLQKNPFAST